MITRPITLAHIVWARLREARRLYYQRLDERPLEGHLAETTFAWGLWLLLPFDTFGSTPSFAAMAFLPEWLWGLATMLLGALMLAGVLTGNGPRLRMSFSLASGLWLGVFSMLAFANFAGTGVPVYLLVARSCLRKGARQ